MRTPDHQATSRREDHALGFECALAHSRADILAGLARALRYGIERLNEGERALASETDHFADLHRRLSEARDALHGESLLCALDLGQEHEPKAPHGFGQLLAAEPHDAVRDLAIEIARAAAARGPDGELLRATLKRLAPGGDGSHVLKPAALPASFFAEIEGAFLWPRVREAWRERQAPLLAARRTLAENGTDDPQALATLRSEVDEHLALARRLGDENPWTVPGPDDREAEHVVSGMHALDALVASYLEQMGDKGSSLRTVGRQAAEEIREKGRERWTSWAAALLPGYAPPPWERWRNRALFPTILARALWRGEIQGRIAHERAKPAGTIYAVFHSITRASTSQLELGLDDHGRQAIMWRDPRDDGSIAVADVPALSEEIFTRGLKLLGSRYTLPTVEWLAERAHTQALDCADRPDVIEIEGGWEAFACAVLEKPQVHPEERANLRGLARMLAGTPIRWQDGARSSSLFMVFENAAAAGRGRGRSVIQFTLDARLLDHEHHRAHERFGPAAGPAQWADWRIVPLPRPRIIAPLAGSPRDTYGPQTVALRLLWLFFTRHGDQLLDEPNLVQVATLERRTIANEAQLPTRFIDPLLEHFVKQRAIIASDDSRFAPADPAARAFIAEGWRRSRVASETGRRGSRAKAAGLRRANRGRKVRLGGDLCPGQTLPSRATRYWPQLLLDGR